MGDERYLAGAAILIENFGSAQDLGELLQTRFRRAIRGGPWPTRWQ